MKAIVIIKLNTITLNNITDFSQFEHCWKHLKTQNKMYNKGLIIVRYLWYITGIWILNTEYLLSRAAWHWGTGWCCREPWTWRHRMMWWGQLGPPFGRWDNTSSSELEKLSVSCFCYGELTVWCETVCNMHFAVFLKCQSLRPSGASRYLMRLGTQEMFAVEEVKGEATEASSSDREIPLWALFKA